MLFIDNKDSVLCILYFAAMGSRVLRHVALTSVVKKTRNAKLGAPHTTAHRGPTALHPRSNFP